MLTFNLKKEWFDKIKSGEKTHEYREVKPYWTKRFKKQLTDLLYALEKDGKNELYPHRLIKFCYGYPHKDDKNKSLIAKVKVVRIINGKNTDLAIDKDVYDIEFELLEG